MIPTNNGLDTQDTNWTTWTVGELRKEFRQTSHPLEPDLSGSNRPRPWRTPWTIFTSRDPSRVFNIKSLRRHPDPLQNVRVSSTVGPSDEMFCEWATSEVRSTAVDDFTYLDQNPRSSSVCRK